MSEWWWDKAYDHNPMNFPDRRLFQRMARLKDDTDPEMSMAANGQLRLRLRPVRPSRPALRVYIGSLPWTRRIG